jgi:predicted methyltransferase
MGKWKTYALLLVLLTANGWLRAEDAPERTAEKILAAKESADRPDEDRARDANRRPTRTLMFFELSDQERVLELFPGSGWYTRILSDVLAERGELYVALATSRISKMADELQPLQILETGTRLIPTDAFGVYDLDSVDLGVESLDLIVTFRNLHNLTPAARAKLLEAAYSALRPGGRLGVVDHTRRHMEPDGVENRRRLDPMQVVLEATRAGFTFVGYSDLHYRSDDELEYEVGARSVAGNTDRFTILLARPE